MKSKLLPFLIGLVLGGLTIFLFDRRQAAVNAEPATGSMTIGPDPHVPDLKTGELALNHGDQLLRVMLTRGEQQTLSNVFARARVFKRYPQGTNDPSRIQNSWDAWKPGR